MSEFKQHRIDVTKALTDVYVKTVDSGDYATADRIRFATQKYISGTRGIPILDPTERLLPDRIF